MSTYADNLTQGERLELSAPRYLSPAEMGDDERPHVATAAACGFRMPSRASVQAHDARLSLYGSTINVQDEEEEEQEDDENELYEHALNKRRDSMREHSFRLPSQRSRRDVREGLAFMGMAWGE